MSTHHVCNICDPRCRTQALNDLCLGFYFACIVFHTELISSCRVRTSCLRYLRSQVLDPGTKDLTGDTEPLQVNVAMLQVKLLQLVHAKHDLPQIRFLSPYSNHYARPLC